MPALPPVPNCLKVTVFGLIDNIGEYPWANVLHFMYSGTAPSNSSCAALATSISGLWETNMGPECPSPTTLTKVIVVDLTSNTAGEGEWLGSVAGSRGDDSIPASACGLISYVSPMRYRGGHPRHYLYVGGNADFQGAAEWSTAFAAEFLAHWKAFITAIQELSVGGMAMGTLCSVSYISKEVNPVPPYRRTTPLVLDLAIGTATSSVEIASQRRRVGRRKR